TRGVELVLEGDEPAALADDLLAIPTPGHTHGHCVFLHHEILFTGDHLAGRSGARGLYAFRGACWYSWPRQVESMRRRLDHAFRHVLPGHGWPYRAVSPEAMREEVARCVQWMEGLSGV